MAKVTVYILSYNYGKYLRKAIDSVFAQKLVDVNLIVFNDGSDIDTDDTHEICQAYSSNYLSFTYIHHRNRRGLQKCSNEALRICSTEYLIRLDADDWFTDYALFLLISRAECADYPSLTYGSFFYVDSDGELVSYSRQHTSNQQPNMHSRPPHGACSLLRCSSLKRIGGYDETLDAQDGWDIWLRGLKSDSTAYVEQPIFYYRQHSNSLSTDSSRLYNTRRQIYSKLKDSRSESYNNSVSLFIPFLTTLSSTSPVSTLQPEHRINFIREAINSVIDENCFTSIIVSFDDQYLVDTISDYFSDHLQSKKLFIHSRDLSSSNPLANKRPALSHYLASFIHDYPNHCNTDIFIYANPNTLTSHTGHLQGALFKLLSMQCDSVISASIERSAVFQFDDKFLRLLTTGNYDTYVDEEEKLYVFTGDFIVAWIDVFKNYCLFGKQTLPYQLS